MNATETIPEGADRRASHPWKPGLLTAADLARYKAVKVAPAGAPELPGHRPLRHGPAVVGRDDGARGAEHHAGLLAPRHRPARPRDVYYRLPRGLAPGLRRPQRATWPTRASSPTRSTACSSDGYAATRAFAMIGPTAPRGAVRHGNPPAPAPAPAGCAASVDRVGSTTHLSVADGHGNVVAYTFTIEQTGGNGVVVPGYGFLLNNELTDFDTASTTAPNSAERQQAPALVDLAGDRHDAPTSRVPSAPRAAPRSSRP